MAEKIKMGTVLIEEGVIFTDLLRLESEPYLNGWRVVKELDGYGLDRKMSEAGWTCFYMAEGIKGSAVALDGEKSLHKAVNQILTQLKLERFNSLEITEVSTKRYLGLPRTMITAHARHIQKSMFLFDWMEKQQLQQMPASSDKRTTLYDSP
ncbi:MAG: hypothetical protein EXQ58_07515 [Acidobacteria bacterium]|nr:hypothetical protein [Acidobacteriota bacterium]